MAVQAAAFMAVWKPAQPVADWPDLPAWQQQTDSDIFEHIEDRSMRA